MITNAECKESMPRPNITNNKAFNNPRNAELPHKMKNS